MPDINLLSRMPEAVRKRAVQREYAPGAPIVRKGDRADRVYLLVRGTTRVSNEFVGGQRYTFARLAAPDIIGDLEVLSGQPCYSTTNEAATACTALSLAAGDFIAWMKSDGETAFLVARLIACKMYPTSNEQGHIKFQPSLERLRSYLLERLGDIDTEHFTLATGRQQIADAIGTSVKTVNRGVAKLKEAGLISLLHGKITMTKAQQERLRAAALPGD